LSWHWGSQRASKKADPDDPPSGLTSPKMIFHWSFIIWGRNPVSTGAITGKGTGSTPPTKDRRRAKISQVVHGSV